MNMWSDKKYVNIAVNVLLFLVAINFLHFGQLILPIICLILFIDNGFRFKVNNILAFTVLCLFGVAFCYFTYRDGIYCVMGFCCPMAYYIGSNIKNPNPGNIKKIIYMIAFAMGLHIVMNSVYELIVHGVHGFFLSSTHYDIWTRDKLSNTVVAVYLDLLIACVYYLLWHEKDRKTRIICLITFVWAMLYLIVIGRRTPVLLLGILFMFSFLYESLVYGNKNMKIKKFIIAAASLAAVLVIGIVAFYAFNIMNCREFLDSLNIIIKFKKGIVDQSRIHYYFTAISLMPEHLFGGREISDIMGSYVHDFGLDIYDYAGIVPFVFMFAYSLSYGKTIIKTIRDKKINHEEKVLFLSVFLAVVIQMFMEPIMSGSTIFLFCCIIIGEMMERMLNED